MTQLKNGLYIDFEWDNNRGPVLVASLTGHRLGCTIYLNLKEYSLDKAIIVAMEELGGCTEIKN